MKVFFGEALNDMVSELRGQAVKNVRLHTLFEVEGNVLKLFVHVTTFCNNQIYESVIPTKKSLEGVAADKRDEFIAAACEEAREKVLERLAGFEIRRGVLQE
jgi:hypothetical protein